MREIEFRAKNFKGEWVIGGCWCFYNVIDQENKAFIIEDGFCKQKVKPETVGQYTGLNDNNGTKIFEGDYILYEDKCKDFPVHEIGFIKYEDAKFVIEIITDKEFGDVPLNNNNIYVDDVSQIVIGNKFDNPELLEVE